MTTLIPHYYEDTILINSGICYRRDVKDRTHIGTPHQIDIWKLSNSNNVNQKYIKDTIDLLLKTLLGNNCKYRLNQATHPYTNQGLEIEVWDGQEWLEVGECGLIPKTLLDTYKSGYAMGLGLDRLVMLKKKIDDIRILYSKHPEIHSQMLNLSKYQTVSNQPILKQKVSLIVPTSSTIESITSTIVDSLEEDENIIKDIKLDSIWEYYDIPIKARKKLNLSINHKNIILEIQYQSLHYTLTHNGCQKVTNKIKEIYK